MRALVMILQNKNTCDINIAGTCLVIFAIYCNIAQPYPTMKHHLDSCYVDITRLTLRRISELFIKGPYRSDLPKNLCTLTVTLTLVKII